MKNSKKAATAVAMVAMVSACASPPMGPTVSVMPGPEQAVPGFPSDDAGVPQLGDQQAVQGQADAANNRAVGSAVIGTVLGAGLGAAIGGGRGAAIGAGSGALVGTAYGANGSQWSQMGIQRQYNVAYEQCMYAHGDQVPNYVAVVGAPVYVVPRPAVVAAAAAGLLPAAASGLSPPPPPPPPGG